MPKKPAEAPAVTLTPYDAEEVLSAAVSISNTGDGLSEAMAVEPAELHIRQKVTVVLECEVTEHRHKAIPKVGSGLQLILRLKAGRATLIDSDLVAEQLDAQQKRIEESKGVHRLPFGQQDWTPEQDEEASRHKVGMHAEGLQEGCPLCDEETAALREEQNA